MNKSSSIDWSLFGGRAEFDRILSSSVAIIRSNLEKIGLPVHGRKRAVLQARLLIFLCSGSDGRSGQELEDQFTEILSMSKANICADLSALGLCYTGLKAEVTARYMIALLHPSSVQSRNKHPPGSSCGSAPSLSDDPGCFSTSELHDARFLTPPTTLPRERQQPLRRSIERRVPSINLSDPETESSTESEGPFSPSDSPIWHSTYTQGQGQGQGRSRSQTISRETPPKPPPQLKPSKNPSLPTKPVNTNSPPTWTFGGGKSSQQERETPHTLSREMSYEPSQPEHLSPSPSPSPLEPDPDSRVGSQFHQGGGYPNQIQQATPLNQNYNYNADPILSTLHFTLQAVQNQQAATQALEQANRTLHLAYTRFHGLREEGCLDGGLIAVFERVLRIQEVGGVDKDDRDRGEDD